MYSQYTLRSLIIHAHAYIYIYIFTYSSHILCTLAQRVNSLSSVESALVISHKYFAGYFSKKKKEKGKRKRCVSASFLSSRSGYKSFLFSGYEHVELSEK